MLQLPEEQRPAGCWRHVTEEDVNSHLSKLVLQESKPENPFQSKDYVTRSEFKALEQKAKQYSAIGIKYREKLEIQVE